MFKFIAWIEKILSSSVKLKESFKLCSDTFLYMLLRFCNVTLHVLVPCGTSEMFLAELKYPQVVSCIHSWQRKHIAYSRLQTVNRWNWCDAECYCFEIICCTLADVYSYPEDDMVVDPLLADHLAHFGIDIMSMKKVKMSSNSLYLFWYASLKHTELLTLELHRITYT